MRVAAVVALGVVAAGCAQEGRAQGVGRAVRRDDPAALTRLLDGVRGVNSLACELATRSVDMHASWSHWGNIGGNPLETDTAAAALIAWIQHEHSDPALVPRLAAAMRDPDGCVRRVAGSFLGRIQHGSAVSALLTGMEDANADTRYVATIGLGLSHDPPGAVQPLIRRLRDESAAVRRAAAWALGSIEDREALTPLIELLQRDADPRVRQAAAWAIGEIDG